MSLLRLLRNARFINHSSPTEQMLVNFRAADALKNLVVGSDQEIGGFSSAELDLVTEPDPPRSSASVGSILGGGRELSSPSLSPDTFSVPTNDITNDITNNNTTNNGTNAQKSTNSGQSPSTFGFGRFHGNLSLDLPHNRPDVIRSGYAMFRTQELQPSLFGIITECWDWKACSHMMLRVRGDRRKYFVNVQADTPLQTDLYQHRLFLKTPGQWETVVIPISSFILTNWGIIQQQVPMNRDQVRTVGIGLTDNQYGPFCLDIDWIKVVSEVHVKALLNGISVANKTMPPPGKRLSIDDFK